MLLDALDRQLVASLKLDGRMSYAELAGRLGVSEGTARNRLARLVEAGTVRILPIVDQTTLGYRLNAWIGVRCQPGAFRRVAEELAGYPGGTPRPAAPTDVVLPLRLATPAGELSFFSITAHVGTAADVTVEELTVEAFYPADEATARALRAAGGRAGGAPDDPWADP